MTASLLRALALSLLVLPLGAVVAAADDGPPRVLSAAGSLRPTETVDRLHGQDGVAALFVIGGFGSDPQNISGFADLAERFPDRQILYFGREDSTYDTRGPIDSNARNLTGYVRTSVKRYDIAEAAVYGHSQGGVVADAAFAGGLGQRDHVTAYVSVGSPHRGATLAQVALQTREEAGDAVESVGAIMRLIGGSDGTDPAVTDLARRKSPEAPTGVRTTTIAVLNDEVVLGRDAHLTGARHVTLFVPTLAAHGSSTRDARVLDHVETAVRGTQEVRPAAIEQAAQAARGGLDHAHMGVFAVLATAVLFAGRLLHRFPLPR
jgi:hypothetical protein